MARITTPVIAQAHVGVQRMSLAQKVALTDEIFKEQPTLLASILVLPRMGVAMEQLDVAIHVLLVTFQAMKRSGHQWPIVTEDIQEGCLLAPTEK
jgi:hypothetical protein